MAPSLEVSSICKAYPGFLLQDVSFSLPAGYVMGLIGPNGAGKTTIIKMILGLVRHDAGRIALFGEDHPEGDASLRSRIGFVHEAPCFFEHLTLEAQKRIVASFYPAWDEACWRRMLSSFGLPAKKRIRQLSRGMKMKFALALALSNNAEMIILDEPTMGLDPVARSELLDLLWGLMQDEKKSVLLSTHITSDLERIADYITFVLDGRLVFSCKKEEIIEKWGIVRGDTGLLSESNRHCFRNVRRHEFGFEALTDDAAAARRCLGPAVLIERASLDDVMFHLSRGGCHA